MKAKRRYIYEPDYAVPPGETLQETMGALEMTQRELAQRTGLTVQTLGRIFRGEQPITYETANRLELATNVPARLWNNLEAQYREQLAKAEERERFQHDLTWLKDIPTKELIDRGEIEPQSDDILLLRETLAFYGVSSVNAWHKIWDAPAVAARRSSCFESRPGPASAWIRIGERQAHEISCQPYDKRRFRESLDAIRKTTSERPEVFVPHMQQLCADSGVSLVFIPEMKKVPWSGATKWPTSSKAMIMLNLRGKAEDKFWFSFFHEAGHVLHDNKRDFLINDGSTDDPREKRASKFAADFLIPPNWNTAIKSAKSADKIREIAQRLEISEGIVAGRYQFLTRRWSYHKGMIRTFKWRNSD
jgi:addiction module HigA family antidote